MNDVLLPFGIRNSEVVHIDDVENGLACGCSCPVCGGVLVAKNHGQKQHHFAHYSSDECSGSLETALHSLAKQILVESKCIFLPELKARASSKDRVGKKYVEEELIVSPGMYQLDTPLLEKKIGDVVADVFATHKGHDLLVEVAVAHFVDEEKKVKIKSINKACIEIDLSQLTDFSIESVKIMILQAAPREWIWSPKYQIAMQRLSKSVEATAKAANHIHQNQIEIGAYRNQKVLEKYAGEYLGSTGLGRKKWKS